MVNDFGTTKVSEVLEKETLEKMYAWSKGFQKFVCCPLAACFLQERTSREIIRFLDIVNTDKLVKVLGLYPHAIREKVLWCFDHKYTQQIIRYLRYREWHIYDSEVIEFEEWKERREPKW